MSLSLESVCGGAVDHALGLLGSGGSVERTYKTGRDYATTVDFVIEDALRELLSRLTPDIGFLGEERGRTGSMQRYWCLDPLDGTTNYVRGIPNYGLALALIEGDQPVLGQIALPAHGERYATRNATAQRNGERIHVAHTMTLAETVVAVGDFATGSGSTDKNQQRIATLTRLADTVGRVRMLGSAATDLAWLATGRLDAVLIHSNHPWDTAAGIAIARAAGATLTHLDNSPYTINGPNLLATTPGIHAALAAALANTTHTRTEPVCRPRSHR